MHSVVVYSHNAVTTQPDIVLESANYESFNKALAEMGKDRDDISRLTNASGWSLTVFTPSGVDDPYGTDAGMGSGPPDIGKPRAIPVRGRMEQPNETDKVGLSLLAGGRSYDELEKDCQSLAQLNDAPMWSRGTYRGVISKIDPLYAIAGAVTSDDLSRYFPIARRCLAKTIPR